MINLIKHRGKPFELKILKYEVFQFYEDNMLCYWIFLEGN